MKTPNLFTKIVTSIISSRISLFIVLALFIYFVIVPLLALIPNLSSWMPNDTTFIIGNNFLAVIAAFGAAVAAGIGLATYNYIKKLHRRHDAIEKSIAELEHKIDRLSKAK